MLLFGMGGRTLIVELERRVASLPSTGRKTLAMQADQGVKGPTELVDRFRVLGLEAGPTGSGAGLTETGFVVGQCRATARATYRSI